MLPANKYAEEERQSSSCCCVIRLRPEGETKGTALKALFNGGTRGDVLSATHSPVGKASGDLPSETPGAGSST